MSEECHSVLHTTKSVFTILPSSHNTSIHYKTTNAIKYDSYGNFTSRYTFGKFTIMEVHFRVRGLLLSIQFVLYNR